MEPTCTIAPPPRSTIARAAACDAQKVGRRIESSASSMCSSVCSRNGPGRKIPVLLTSTSTPPKRSTASSTSRSAAACELTSPATSAMRSPVGSSSRSAASSTDRRRLESTTEAPSSRNLAAAALPIPPPPPVITIVFPSKSDISAPCVVSKETICTRQLVSAQTTCYRRPMPVPEQHLAAWRALLNTHASVVGRVEAALTEEGLPPLSWYDVLWAVRRAPDRRVRMAELADGLTLSRGGLTKLVDRLEGAGHLRREAAESDGRGLYAVL